MDRLGMRERFEMNVSELSGPQLDCWVARAEGKCYTTNPRQWGNALINELGRLSIAKTSWDCARYFEPSSNWTHGGPILERQRYTLYPLDEIGSNGAPTRRVWIAEAQMNPDFHDLYRDELPLVAICRLRVAEAIATGVIRQ